MHSHDRKDKFFFAFSTSLLLLVCGAFGANAVVNRDQLPSGSSILTLHIVAMFVWYMLVSYQSWLVRSDNLQRHMLLGKFSIMLAFAILLTGGLTVIKAYPTEIQGVEVVTYNFLILSLFSVFYGFALYYRRRPAAHKRLMLFASLAVIHPALFRISRIFGVTVPIDLILLLLLVASIVVYDIRALRKLHPATLLGAIATIMTFVVIITLISIDGWREFVIALMAVV